MKICYEKKEDIAIITMDDGKANAMDISFFKEMNDTLDLFEKDKCKTLIITGRPGFFSGGLDLKLLTTLSLEDIDSFIETFAKTMLRIYTLPNPTIAALSGHAIAGGVILAFSCDVVLATDGPFKIQMNEVPAGMALPSWMLLIAKSLVPVRWQTEVLLHGKAYTPKEAMNINILNELIEEGGDLLEVAKTKACELSMLNLTAYAATKRRMRTTEDVDHTLSLLEAELPSKMF